MTGLLIYTVSGNSEGTLGGLVRKGLPGRLENSVSASINDENSCISNSRTSNHVHGRLNPNAKTVTNSSKAIALADKLSSIDNHSMLYYLPTEGKDFPWSLP